MSEYERDTARLQSLLSGESELGRSEAAWNEADLIARRIADRGGFVEVPNVYRSWHFKEELSDLDLDRLASRPLEVRALAPEVRKWIKRSIVAMRKRQGA